MSDACTCVDAESWKETRVIRTGQGDVCMEEGTGAISRAAWKSGDPFDFEKSFGKTDVVYAADTTLRQLLQNSAWWSLCV